MLIMIWAAATATAVPQQNAESPCPAGRILVEHVIVDPAQVIAPFGWSADAKAQAFLVSKTLEPDNSAPGHEILPKGNPRSKGPAVLMPGCKSSEERKKKDYPMA